MKKPIDDFDWEKILLWGLFQVEMDKMRILPMFKPKCKYSDKIYETIAGLSVTDLKKKYETDISFQQRIQELF